MNYVGMYGDVFRNYVEILAMFIKCLEMFLRVCKLCRYIGDVY